jgi:hypothetical protein
VNKLHVINVFDSTWGFDKEEGFEEKEAEGVLD